MQQQLILHIGLHKTGSTSIQEFLRMNSKQLAKKGLDVIREHNLRDVWNSDNPPDFLSVWQPVVDRLISSSQSLLLTDETLSEIFSKNPSAARLLKEHFPHTPVKFIVYLRRQDQHYESFYKTLVRDYDHTSPHNIDHVLESPEYKHIHDYNSRYHQEPVILQNYDYHGWLSELAKEVGKDNVIVRAFERKQFVNGSLYEDFINALGLPWSESFQTPERDINIGINSKILELCRKTNRVYDDNMEKRLFSSFMIYISEAMEMDAPKGFLSNKERERILARFTEGNDLVARDFLGSETLFTAPADSDTQKLGELNKEEFEQTMLLMHHFWYELVCNLDFSLLNFIRIERARRDRSLGVKGARIRHFIHKTIHSIGKRLFKNWRTSTGEMKMLLEEPYLYVDLEELKRNKRKYSE